MLTYPLLALFYLLNYFWLSLDPKQSASWYCDQHCFKIGSEVIESVWDAVLSIDPSITQLADDQGIPATYRKRRHAKEGCLWHPLSVWNGLTRANMRRSLINAKYIFLEHKSRTGKIHSAYRDCKFLLKCVDNIDFNSRRWRHWFSSQNGDSESKYRPSKTKTKDLTLRAQWCLTHATLDGVSITKLDRNSCDMTEPPQCINDKEFPGCKVDGDVVTAYRNYYQLKTKSLIQGMRYLYTSPPQWLHGSVQIERASTAKRSKPTKRTAKRTANRTAIKYKLDKNGYVVIKFL